MRDLTEEWKQTAKRTQEAFDIAQDDIRGSGLSRQSGWGRAREEAKDRKSGRSGGGERAALSALDAMLAGSPEYRALHTKAMRALVEAETLAEETITQLENDLHDAQGELAPVGCNTTLKGRSSNRRVEVWLRDRG